MIDSDCKKEILKSCISDHFAIILAFQIDEKKVCNKSEQHICQRTLYETSIESFRLRLWEIKSDNLKTSNNSNLAYNEFLNTFTSLNDDCFPRVKIKVKAQNPFRTWIIKGITKSYRVKQKLYEKCLKNLNPQNLATYKAYTNLFETIKRKSKKKYYSEKVLSYNSDARKTWKTMIYLIGKAKMNESPLPQIARTIDSEKQKYISKLSL